MHSKVTPCAIIVLIHARFCRKHSDVLAVVDAVDHQRAVVVVVKRHMRIRSHTQTQSLQNSNFAQLLLQHFACFQSFAPCQNVPTQVTTDAIPPVVIVGGVVIVDGGVVVAHHLQRVFFLAAVITKMLGRDSHNVVIDVRRKQRTADHNNDALEYLPPMQSNESVASALDQLHWAKWHAKPCDTKPYAFGAEVNSISETNDRLRQASNYFVNRFARVIGTHDATLAGHPYLAKTIPQSDDATKYSADKAFYTAAAVFQRDVGIASHLVATDAAKMLK